MNIAITWKHFTPFWNCHLSQFMSHPRKIKEKIYGDTSYTTDGKIFNQPELVLIVIEATDIGTDSMKMIKVHN